MQSPPQCVKFGFSQRLEMKMAKVSHPMLAISLALLLPLTCFALIGGFHVLLPLMLPLAAVNLSFKAIMSEKDLA